MALTLRYTHSLTDFYISQNTPSPQGIVQIWVIISWYCTLFISEFQILPSTLQHNWYSWILQTELWGLSGCLLTGCVKEKRGNWWYLQTWAMVIKVLHQRFQVKSCHSFIIFHGWELSMGSLISVSMVFIFHMYNDYMDKIVLCDESCPPPPPPVYQTVQTVI